MSAGQEVSCHAEAIRGAERTIGEPTVRRYRHQRHGEWRAARDDGRRELRRCRGIFPGRRNIPLRITSRAFGTCTNFSLKCRVPLRQCQHQFRFQLTTALLSSLEQPPTAPSLAEDEGRQTLTPRDPNAVIAAAFKTAGSYCPVYLDGDGRPGACFFKRKPAKGRQTFRSADDARECPLSIADIGRTFRNVRF
jgi:hypothetical protein